MKERELFCTRIEVEFGYDIEIDSGWEDGRKLSKPK